MKHVILCCVVLFLLTTAAQAQSVKFGIQGDITNLNVGDENLRAVYGLGYGGGAHLDVSLGIISFRLSGDYITISPDQEKFKSALQKFGLGALVSGFTLEGGRIDVISGNLNLKLGILPLPIISVYLTGGAGVARLSVSEVKVKYNGIPLTTAPAVAAETKPTVNAGAGADINLGGLALFGEVKVTWILTEGQTSALVPLATVGLTF